VSARRRTRGHTVCPVACCGRVVADWPRHLAQQSDRAHQYVRVLLDLALTGEALTAR
jgi:hypothetical protein